MSETALSRSAAILGEAAMGRLAAAHVAVFGVGGVGGWCAEALVRTGVGRITLVDYDTVQLSNLNRQAPATTSTLGRLKVEALRERLWEINPAATVVARAERFETAAKFGGLERFDIVVDAIDDVAAKAELIVSATEGAIPIVSSLGAALRTDPTCVRLVRFDKVAGDALARALRQRFKRIGRYPAAKFPCAVSEESALAPADAVRGSLMQVTATFGMVLASAAIRLLTGEKGEWSDGRNA